MREHGSYRFDQNQTQRIRETHISHILDTEGDEKNPSCRKSHLTLHLFPPSVPLFYSAIKSRLRKTASMHAPIEAYQVIN